MAFGLFLQVGVAALAQSDRGGGSSRVVEISIAGARVIAASDSPLALVEFSDYQCPFCRKFVEEVLPPVLDAYVLSGILQYAFMDFPLQHIHPQATEAAYAAHCAGEQGRYWEMHDRLFLDQHMLRWRKWHEFASWVGVDVPSFIACMHSGRYAGAVADSHAVGEAAGVRGTPTFFLGIASPDGRTVRINERIAGTRSYASFRKWIDRWLEQQRR